MAVVSFNLLNIFMTAILNSVNSYFFISLRSFSCDLFLWMSHISLLFACLDIFCQNLGMWKTNYFSQSLWHSSEQGGTSSVSLARESSDLWSLFRECVFSGLVCLISLLKRFAKSQSGVPHTVCMSYCRFWNTLGGFRSQWPSPGTLIPSVLRFRRSGSSLKDRAVDACLPLLPPLRERPQAVLDFAAPCVLWRTCPSALICSQRSPGIWSVLSSICALREASWNPMAQ